MYAFLVGKTSFIADPRYLKIELVHSLDIPFMYDFTIYICEKAIAL